MWSRWSQELHMRHVSESGLAFCVQKTRVTCTMPVATSVARPEKWRSTCESSTQIQMLDPSVANKVFHVERRVLKSKSWNGKAKSKVYVYVSKPIKSPRMKNDFMKRFFVEIEILLRIRKTSEESKTTLRLVQGKTVCEGSSDNRHQSLMRLWCAR